MSLPAYRTAPPVAPPAISNHKARTTGPVTQLRQDPERGLFPKDALRRGQQGDFSTPDHGPEQTGVFRFRLAADYGGVVNAVLCGVHCAAGPLLFAWWGARNPGAALERWELGFLVLSGVLVALATWRQSSVKLRLALWTLFFLLVASALLAERWPPLAGIQYAASAGLIGTHLLNRRHCRCCAAGSLPCVVEGSLSQQGI